MTGLGSSTFTVGTTPSSTIYNGKARYSFTPSPSFVHELRSKTPSSSQKRPSAPDSENGKIQLYLRIVDCDTEYIGSQCLEHVTLMDSIVIITVVQSFKSWYHCVPPNCHLSLSVYIYDRHNSRAKSIHSLAFLKFGRDTQPRLRGLASHRFSQLPFTEF